MSISVKRNILVRLEIDVVKIKRPKTTFLFIYGTPSVQLNCLAFLIELFCF